MSQQMSLGLRQDQRLTPQLIQSMNILQLPLLALEAKIMEELERNPALEESERSATSDGEDRPTVSDVSALSDPDAQAESKHEAESFSRLERLSREYDFDDSDQAFGRRQVSAAAGERDAKMDAMANTASRPESLNEYLKQQWAFVEVNGRVREAGDLLINYINDHGYLEVSLEELAEQHVPSFALDELREALRWVQTLDPAGIGARDLRECLLLQLDRLEANHELERLLVDRHLTDIEKNRYPAMSKSTGREIDEIKQAVGNLRRLYPHPGMLVVERRVPTITPDVIVEYDDEREDYTVRLTRGNSLRLRISKTYRDMLRNRANDKDTRDFIRRNVESAGALIDAIQYRRNRLLEVAEEIVTKQRDFFDQGPAGLKIMRMSDLAEKLECDPSTVSRTVADKYMQTPRGIFPLRMFFTGGTEDETGKEKSWDSVRARVKEIIDNEDKRKPLNDDVIAAKLQAEGLTVSRRTIAKYRQQLHIPTARQRREY